MESSARFRLGLSCGHGGPGHSAECAEGGQCRACGTKAGLEAGMGVEADYVRLLGEELADALPGLVDIVWLNRPHETIPPSVRGSRARAAECGAVLALHVNESQSPTAHGAHMLHLPDVSPRSPLVARAIADGWPQPLRRALFPSRLERYYVAGMVEPATRDLWPSAHSLLMSYAPVPTILVEAFYASNSRDASAALNPWVRLEMVGALVRGVAVAAQIWQDEPEALPPGEPGGSV